MSPTYRTKSKKVEAVELPVWDEEGSVTKYLETSLAIAQWCGGTSFMMDDKYPRIEVPSPGAIRIALPGWFILKGADGTFYPKAPEAFWARYEEIEK